MTYCIGVLLDQGMIFASDSRTNAGLDNIAKFCKMTVFERPGDRVIVLLSSGNLAGTQAVISVLNQRCAAGDAAGNLWGVRTMFDAAMPVADAMERVLVSFDSTMRSNLSVGMPIDLICYERDSLEVRRRRRFDEGDAYFTALSREWSEGTRQVFRRLPELSW
jgi:predicted proteasome-type protease